MGGVRVRVRVIRLGLSHERGEQLDMHGRRVVLDRGGHAGHLVRATRVLQHEGLALWTEVVVVFRASLSQR